MTREEIQAQCLELPEAERAALAQQLADSLKDPESLEALRARLDAREAAEMRVLGQKLEAQMESWFEGEGESVEVTDEWWEKLLTREPTEEELDRPLGLSVPPEWTGRTLRELRAAKQK